MPVTLRDGWILADLGQVLVDLRWVLLDLPIRLGLNLPCIAPWGMFISWQWQDTEEDKPNPTNIFQAFAHITYSNIPLARVSHIVQHQWGGEIHGVSSWKLQGHVEKCVDTEEGKEQKTMMPKAPTKRLNLFSHLAYFYHSNSSSRQHISFLFCLTKQLWWVKPIWLIIFQ